MTEPDEYERRAAELRDAVFEVGGYVAMLSPGNTEGRDYWHRVADRADRERRILLDHGDELRELDGQILDVSDSINDERDASDDLAARWMTAARVTGVAGALLEVGAGLGLLPGWTAVVGFALVAVCIFAAARTRLVGRRSSEPILRLGTVLHDLEAQRAAILSGSQSPSPRMAASTPDQSSTDSQADTLEIPVVSS